MYGYRRSETHTSEESIARWYHKHGETYPPASICSKVRYRIFVRAMRAKNAFKFTPPKGGLHPPCLADEQYMSKSNHHLFFKNDGR